MANELQRRKVAILAANGVERVELEQPRQAVQDTSDETQILSIHSGEIQARSYDIEEARTFTVEGLVSGLQTSNEVREAAYTYHGGVAPMRVGNAAMKRARTARAYASAAPQI
jgi:putative intracellular protease/amidase